MPLPTALRGGPHAIPPAASINPGRHGLSRVARFVSELFHMLATLAALAALYLMLKNDAEFAAHLAMMNTIKTDVAIMKQRQRDGDPTLERIAEKVARLVELYEKYLALAASGKPEHKRQLEAIGDAIKKLRGEIRRQPPPVPNQPAPSAKRSGYKPGKGWNEQVPIFD